MKIFTLLPPLALFFLSSAEAAEGDIRFRLQKRHPETRGVLENYYTGDGFDMFGRLRFSSGSWSFVMLTDKARGEDWGDIAAAGCAWQPDSSRIQTVSAGFLKAELGSGCVLAVPGSFSGASEISMYKPPIIRNRVEPATSAGGCRGTPLTGAGGIFRLGGTRISAVATISPFDSLSSGLHRTPSEVEGRGDFLEKLGAVRLESGIFGLTAAAGMTDRGEDHGWFRTGTDFRLPGKVMSLTGEAVLGIDSAGTETAGWISLWQEFSVYRHMLTLLRNPEDFPEERSSFPLSRDCDVGLCYGFRWKIVPGMALKSGTGAYFSGEDLLITSSELQYRFPWSMKVHAGFRVRLEETEDSWRSWLSGNWQPTDGLLIRTKVQLTGWNGQLPDSSETGAGLEVKLRYSPFRRVQLDMGGAGCSTDGYSSRVYSGGVSFPGVFGSRTMYNRSFLFFAGISAEITSDLFLRLGFSSLTMEDASSMGSGWEETSGDSRSEMGVQLDWAFQ